MAVFGFINHPHYISVFLKHLSVQYHTTVNISQLNVVLYDIWTPALMYFRNFNISSLIDINFEEAYTSTDMSL